MPQLSRWLMDIALVLALAVFLVHMLGDRMIADGVSMSPTIESGELLLINKFKGSVASLERFDLIAYRSEDGSKSYVKRIVGLPGEIIEIIDGRIWINSRLLETKGLVAEIKAAGLAAKPILLGEDEYFVLGDNADASEDSRFANVGNIPAERILGNIWLRLSPFQRLGIVSDERPFVK